MPGRIAAGRGHPQADAIRVLGWIGVITLGLAWPFALVWAYTRSESSHTGALRERIATLESELALKAQDMPMRKYIGTSISSQKK